MTPSWPALALIFALYFAGVKLGLLTILPEGMAVFWPPNGVVLAALLRYGRPSLIPIAATALAAEAAASWPAFPLTQALMFGSLNFAEAALAWLLLSRLRFDPAFSALADVWKFLLAAPAIAAFCAALGGAAIYAFLREGGGSYLQYLQFYWFGDGLGLIVVTPLVYGLFYAQRGAPVRLGLADLAVWSGAALVLTAFIFFPVRELLGAILSPILLLPAVLYSAARYSPRWTALAVFAMAYALILAMIFGRQPFGALPPRQAVLHAQEFILVLAIMGLGFSALIFQLRAKNAELEARVQARTAALEEANRRLERLATVDPLSGIANRRGFDYALTMEIERCRRYGGDLALALADLDGFKAINDRYGHAAGDEVLRAFARVLEQSVRATDVVARIGGEEFAILMPQATAAQALDVAQRARVALARQAIAPIEGPVTASFGVAHVPGRLADGPRLMAGADRALYEAKALGRNRVVAGEVSQASDTGVDSA